MKHYIVYKYEFPNGMIYIGVTKNTIQVRREQGYQHNRQLQDAVKQFGWNNVTTEILEENLSEDEAFSKEIDYIGLLNANDPRKGFNVSKGGKATFAGLKHTEEHKKYMSSVLTGKTFSQTHIDNLKHSHAFQRKSVSQYSKNGKFIQHFNSLADAAACVGGCKANISRAVLNGKPYKGFLWKEVV